MLSMSTISQVTPTIQSTKIVTLNHGNYSNTTDMQQYRTFTVPVDLILPEPHPKWLTNIFFAFYILIIVLSIIGNIFVIAVFVKSKKLKTVTDIYIISLSISDLLIATLNMPFQLYFTVENEWMSGGTTGKFFCKFTNYIQGCTVVSSILTLLTIAIDRYMVICRAKFSHRHRRQKTAIIAMAIVWIVAVLVVIPHLIYQKVQIRLKIMRTEGVILFNGVSYVCVEEFPSHPIINAQRVYSLIQYVGFYLLPVTIMTFTYGHIGHKLWIHQPIGDILANPQNHTYNIIQKRRIVRMLMLIFLSFTLLWFPFFTFAIYSEFVSLDKTYRVKLTALKLVGYSTCCINPVIYTFLNKGFRQELSRISCKGTQPILVTNQIRTNDTMNSRF